MGMWTVMKMGIWMESMLMEIDSVMLMVTSMVMMKDYSMVQWKGM